MENLTDSNPKIDTGKWRAEILSIVQGLAKDKDDERKRYEALCAQVKRVADQYDKEHQNHEKERGIIILIWKWLKNSLSHAAEEAKKIYIE